MKKEIDISGMNLVQKLAKVRDICDVVTKSKSGYNYKYPDIVEILAKVKAGMKMYHISLLPLITPGTTDVSQNVTENTKVSKTGSSYVLKTTEMLVKADATFRWINDDNPEDFIDVPWTIVGMQADPSQAFGSALTYCTRYFLCNYFQIAQPGTDVDEYRSKQKEAEESEDRAVAEEIIGRFDIMVKKFLSDHSDQKENVRVFTGKYIKGSDYKKIKSPEIAKKLYEDFVKKFNYVENKED